MGHLHWKWGRNVFSMHTPCSLSRPPEVSMNFPGGLKSPWVWTPCNPSGPPFPTPSTRVLSEACMELVLGTAPENHLVCGSWLGPPGVLDLVEVAMRALYASNNETLAASYGVWFQNCAIYYFCWIGLGTFISSYIIYSSLFHKNAFSR